MFSSNYYMFTDKFNINHITPTPTSILIFKKFNFQIISPSNMLRIRFDRKVRREIHRPLVSRFHFSTLFVYQIRIYHRKGVPSFHQGRSE